MRVGLYLLRCFFIVLLIAIPALAQTANDFEKRYGSPTKEYELRPGIVLMAKYADDGEVCTAYVERRHISESGFDLRLDLPEELITELSDELVPVASRGNTTKANGINRITGAVSDQLYDYENVSIIVLHSAVANNKTGLGALIIKWKNRSCK